MDGFVVLGQRILLSLSVLVVGAGGIGTTLVLFLAASGVGRITVMDHNDVKLSNLHSQVIHTEGRRGTSKARSARDDMRALNPTVSVTAVIEPLNWDKDMELLRGNDCVVDTSDNPRKMYLINNICVLAEKEPKTAAMTNGSGGVPTPMVNNSAIGTEGQLTVYNHWGGEGVLTLHIPQA